MKINNVAIAGIFVTIFGLIETANATTIASQAYVDAKDGLKQDKLTSASGGNVSVDNTSNTAATRAVTGITATNGVLTFATQPIAAGITASDVVENHDTSALSITNASTMTTKAPSVKAVYNMVRKSDANGGAIRATSSASDVLVPTEKAVATALANKVDASALSTENVVITSNNHGIPEAGAVQSGILYMEGIGIGNITGDVTLSDVTSAKSWTTADGQDASIKNMRSDKNMDKYIPTVAAVEARAKALEAYATQAASNAAGNITHPVTNGSNVMDLNSNTTTNAPTIGAVQGMANKSTDSNAVTNLTTRSSSGSNINQITSTGADNKVPTTALLVDVLQTLDQSSYGDDEAGTKPVTSITEVDGKIFPKRGTITSAGLADGAVAGGSGGKIQDKTVTYNYDMNNTALYDINTGATPASTVCTESNPCILTYYKKDGKVYTRWTPMDTENTSANSATTDAGATI